MPKIRDLDAVREAVRDECDLQEVIEGYGYDFVPFGTDHVATTCPFHTENDPSFAVSESKQVYICYGCKEGGDVFTFIQKMEGLGHVDAIRHLADWAGMDISAYEAPESREEREARRLIATNQEVHQALVTDSKNQKELRKWRVTRALDADVVERYGLCYSRGVPDVSPARAKTLGLTWDKRWTDVVVVPLKDEHGSIMGFRNRRIYHDGKLRVIGPDNNHPLPIPLLYGYYEARTAIRSAGAVILVEGEIDVLQMAAHGYENVCGTFGTDLDDGALGFLHERGVREIVVMPDGDEAGRKFARKVARLRHEGLTIKIASLQGTDPDDALLEDPQIVKDSLRAAKLGVEYIIDQVLLTNDAFTYTQKMEALRDIKEAIGPMTRLEEEVAVATLTERLGVSTVAITDHFREIEASGNEKLHNTRAEKAVIARALDGDQWTGEIIMGLSAEDFHLTRHAQIFEAIGSLYRAGQEVNRDTIAITLERMRAGDAVDYLDTIQDRDAIATGFMIEELREKSAKRKIERLARGIMGDVKNPTLPGRQLVQGVMGSLSQIIVGKDVGLTEMGGLVDNLIDTLHERMKDPTVIVGWDLGSEWQTLNRTIHGLQTNRYFVFAAPSSVGKTTALICFASRLSVDLQVPSLVLTFETGKDVLTQRIISHRARVKQESITTGYVGKDELKHIHAAAAEVGAAPLVITERGRYLEDAQAIIQHDVLTRGTQLVLIDYAQLMHLSDKGQMPRYREIGHISNALQTMTEELNLSIVLFAQINREGSKAGSNADHTHVGDSFQLAQDATIFVTMLEKTKEDIEVDGLDKGNRILKISKNRKDGPTGVMWHAHADVETQRIVEVVT